MADPRHALGLACEDATAAWLERAGWRILARRQRSVAGGEVDLVAIDPDGFLVAIEVRGRRTHRMGSAAESIDARRARRLRRTLIEVARAGTDAPAGLRVDLVGAEPAPDAPGRWRLTRIPGVG
jgi:putative endonuclease